MHYAVLLCDSDRRMHVTSTKVTEGRCYLSEFPNEVEDTW